MNDFAPYALRVPEILLPDKETDLRKWSVVACDQYTSQPEYWDRVSEYVLGAPSTLNIIYPEAWLSEGDARIPRINAAMREYEKSVLTRRVSGFVLTERTTQNGARPGLMAEVDLEQYDYAPGSASAIRATEGTILERIPPRVRIRRDAPLESPHILMLADDPGRTLIEPLYARRAGFEPLYDFELMEGGGHARGWKVPESAHAAMRSALSALREKAEGLLWAVGDGNHSLATARACWLEKRDAIAESERASHPARYALVELVNVHAPEIVFEPIHRAIFGASARDLEASLDTWLAARDMRLIAGQMFRLNGHWLGIERLRTPLPLQTLQPFLDEYLSAHTDARVDYIHGGLDALEAEGAATLELTSMDKNALFEGVRRGGALPRKTFSMGEAHEKRYYLECRSIRQE